MLKKYLQIHPEVEAAVKEGKPVVALESTIILKTHDGLLPLLFL